MDRQARTISTIQYNWEKKMEVVLAVDGTPLYQLNQKIEEEED